MSMIDSLYQKEKWGKGEDARPISELETRHVMNVVSWIWRNRENLKAACEAEMVFAGPTVQGEAANDAFEDAFDELLTQNANEWFGELPIIAAFRDLITGRDGDNSTAQWLTRMTS